MADFLDSEASESDVSFVLNFIMIKKKIGEKIDLKTDFHVEIVSAI